MPVIVEIGPKAKIDELGKTVEQFYCLIRKRIYLGPKGCSLLRKWCDSSDISNIGIGIPGTPGEERTKVLEKNIDKLYLKE